MTQDQKDKVSILKSIWRKNDAGLWMGHDLQGLDLKPRKDCGEGYTDTYFKIDNDMQLLTQRPGVIFESLFETFGGTEFLVRQSIVPIVAWNDGDKEMHCIGTGFFISASGYLLTAAHVLRDPVDENYTTLIEVKKNQFKLSENLKFGILLPNNPAARNAPFNVPQWKREAKWFMCSFEGAYHWGHYEESPLLHEKPRFVLDIDIAVCKVKQHPGIGPYQPLNIAQYKAAVGNQAVAIGYPEMRNIKMKDDDYQPELVVSIGTVTNIHADNITEKKNSTPGPNFEFDAKIPGKMSGSPILVGGGVFTKGVVSRSLGNYGDHASGCLIAPMMQLPIKGIGGDKSLLELQRSGNEGIAQFAGAGL